MTFADVQQMPQVRAGEIFAGITFAPFLNWPEVGFIETGLDVDGAFGRERRSVARDARGQNAVEHIHAARDEFDHLRGRAEAHGVSRFVRRQKRFGVLDGFHHLGFGFTDAHTADGVAVEIQRDQRLGAFFAERGVAAALHDAENKLAPRARLFAAFGGPAHRALDSVAHFVRRGGVGGAFVEAHGDVGGEHTLDVHGFLGTEEQKRAVKMRAEFHAVLLDFANLGEAENLEAAAVGENGFGPVDELVEITGGGDDVEAGAEMEMVGVAENDLRAHLEEFARVEGLNAALCADGHEHGRFNDAAGGREASEAGAGRRVGLEQFVHEPPIEAGTRRFENEKHRGIDLEGAR